MTTKPKPGSQNGKFEAPHFLNGASLRVRERPVAPSRQRTVFPDDPQQADWRRPAYILDQFLFFGAPLRRHVTFLLAALAAIAALGALPGRWWTAAILLALVVAFTIYLRTQRARNFVEFNAAPAPDPVPTRLDPADKVAVHVTGHFTVEGKYKHFSQVPGFYRTFASGEHALLCLIRERIIMRMGHWPKEDIGMWYIFFTPDLIQNLAWGELAFGPDNSTAIAVTYRLTIPPGDKQHKEIIQDETVYISTETDEDALCIWADLLWELPPTAQPARVAQSRVTE